MREYWITDWSILGLIRKQHKEYYGYIFHKCENRIVVLFIPVFYFTN